MSRAVDCAACGGRHREATAKQARFAAEYLLDLNATQAAVRAGYSKKNAGSLGYQLLQKTPIACLVQQGAEARAERTGVDADWVLRRLARVADFDLELSVDEIAKLPDRIKCLELVGRHLRMFTDRLEVESFDYREEILKGRQRALEAREGK